MNINYWFRFYVSVRHENANLVQQLRQITHHVKSQSVHLRLELRREQQQIQYRISGFLRKRKSIIKRLLRPLKRESIPQTKIHTPTRRLQVINIIKPDLKFNPISTILCLQHKKAYLLDCITLYQMENLRNPKFT